VREVEKEHEVEHDRSGENRVAAQEVESMNAQPTPDRIMQTGLGFWASKTLLSAIEMGLFTELARGPESFDAITGRLDLHPRAARDPRRPATAPSPTRAREPRYPPPVEHRLHGDDGLEIGRDRREVLLVEHPGGTGGLEHVARDRIPPPEHEVIETCQWQDLADEVLPGFRPGADLDACHLAQ
jgi:hypothetical protein